MYDRSIRPIPKRPTTGLRYRIESLIGITGWKMRKYRIPLFQSALRPFQVLFKPQMFLSALWMGVAFGWSIGINTTLVIFLQSPPPFGYAFSGDAVSSIYVTPIIATFIGELAGHWVNDFLANRYVKRNHGVFEPEARLQGLYLALLVMIPGLLALGGTLQHHLSVAGIVFGWGLYTCGVMLAISSIYAYASDCFPHKQGEVSAIINQARVLMGFAVAYFQVPWATRSGALEVFGVEISIVVGVFILVIPFLQWKGRTLRAKFPDSGI